MTREQIKLLVERSGVKLPESFPAGYVAKTEYFYTEAQLHAVIAAMQEKLEAAEKDAAQWRAYKARKDAAIGAGLGRNPMRQSKPCGECHLTPGETCAICGAKEPK